jgi:hypothetical protein
VTDDPTFTGYQAFLTNIVGVPADQMPVDVDPNAVQFSYDFSLNMTYWWLLAVPSQITSPSIYATAVYSLGADTLINYAPDIPGSSDPTYWSDLRDSFNINNFVGGVINFSSDQSTSQGIAVSDFLKSMTLGDLQNLKTPWGRMYLSIAQNIGTLWGIS